MTKLVVQHVKEKISQLDTAYIELFGRESGLRVRRYFDKAYADLEKIADQHGIQGRIIAVVGTKNAGKSSFCASFVSDEKVLKDLKLGETSLGATQKATWIGSQKPKSINEELEVWIKTSALRKLEEDYTLVDVPGLNDMSLLANHAALEAIRLASIVVLMTTFESLENESIKSYLLEGENFGLVPIITDDKYGFRSQQEVNEELDKFYEHLKKLLPENDIEYPICVPRWSFHQLSQEERDALKSEANRLFVHALESAFERLPADPEILANAVYQRLLANLQSEVESFKKPLIESYRQLSSAEDELMQEISQQIIGDEKTLNANIRLRMVANMVDTTPRWMFPYRSLMATLAATVGAWDKLILSLAGSLPSLAMLLLQTGKNIKTTDENKVLAREDLVNTFIELVDSKLTPVYNNLHNKMLKKSQPTALSWNSQQKLELQKKLVLTIEHQAHLMLDEQTIVTRNTRFNKTVGMIAFALWLSLVIGPVLSIYIEHIGKTIVMFGGESVSWSEYPLPGLGMIFSTIVISFLPVLILAMFSQSWLVSDQLIRDSSIVVRKCLQDSLKKLVRQQAEIYFDSPIRSHLKLIINEFNWNNS